MPLQKYHNTLIGLKISAQERELAAKDIHIKKMMRNRRNEIVQMLCITTAGEDGEIDEDWEHYAPELRKRIKKLLDDPYHAGNPEVHPEPIT